MESLPLEVVQIILRYVIGVPMLFDSERLLTTPDHPLTIVNFYNKKSIMANQKSYWDAERYRNASRRVCKAWDAYLRSFEHRLVHLDDIFETQSIPIESISKALYISPTTGEHSASSIMYKDEFLAVLRQLDMPTRIRALFFPDEGFDQEEASTLAQWAPQLRTVISSGGLSAPVRDLPALVHGSTAIDTPKSLDLLCNLPTTLRSLSIKIDSRDAEVAYTGETDLAPGPLPSLDFLRIWTADEEDTVLLRTILLSPLGSRITALHLMIPPMAAIDIDSMLDLCPRIQIIYLNIFAYHRVRRPETHSRLHTLIIALLLLGLRDPVTYEELPVWPGWPHVRRIISTDQWSTIRRRPIYNVADWASRWQGSPVRIEDTDGISIQEWLVNQAEHT